MQPRSTGHGTARLQERWPGCTSTTAEPSGVPVRKCSVGPLVCTWHEMLSLAGGVRIPEQGTAVTLLHTRSSSGQQQKGAAQVSPSRGQGKCQEAINTAPAPSSASTPGQPCVTPPGC